MGVGRIFGLFVFGRGVFGISSEGGIRVFFRGFS